MKNEMQGTPTPAILVENINKGCELIEKTFDRLGQECS